MLSTSCNLCMLSTIRGISWYGKDPLPKDIPDSQNELLPKCQTTTKKKSVFPPAWTNITLNRLKPR